MDTDANNEMDDPFVIRSIDGINIDALYEDFVAVLIKKNRLWLRKGENYESADSNGQPQTLRQYRRTVQALYGRTENQWRTGAVCDLGR